jgi:hypothetical protein
VISGFDYYVSPDTILSLPYHCKQLKDIGVLEADIPIGEWAGAIGELVCILYIYFKNKMIFH